MRHKLNFLNNRDIFKYKFGREPKEWTISEIHELWQRTLKRAEKMRQPLIDIRKEVIEKIEPNERGEYIIYYNTTDWKDEDAIAKYEFKWSSDFKTYGVSSEIVEFGKYGPPEKVREYKIDFLMQNEVAFELGEKYNKANNCQSRIHFIVGSILKEMVDEKLREMYREKDEIPPSMLQVQINDKTYYVECDKQSRFCYPKFEFLGEVKDDKIKL